MSSVGEGFRLPVSFSESHQEVRILNKDFAKVRARIFKDERIETNELVLNVTNIDGIQERLVFSVDALAHKLLLSKEEILSHKEGHDLERWLENHVNTMMQEEELKKMEAAEAPALSSEEKIRNLINCLKKNLDVTEGVSEPYADLEAIGKLLKDFTAEELNLSFDGMKALDVAMSIKDSCRESINPKYW